MVLVLTLDCLIKQLQGRIQSMQKAAAHRQDHAQPLLCSLHWIRAPERISFRLALLPPWLCTRLSGVRSAVCFWSQWTSATVPHQLSWHYWLYVVTMSSWQQLPRLSATVCWRPFVHQRLPEDWALAALTSDLNAQFVHWLQRDSNYCVTCPHSLWLEPCHLCIHHRHHRHPRGVCSKHRSSTATASYILHRNNDEQVQQLK